MKQHTVETTIDGTDFLYRPLDLKEARALFDKLAQRFGPAIASAVEGLGSAKLDVNMEFTAALGGITDSAGGLVRGVVSGLDPEFHAWLADHLAARTEFRLADSGNMVPLKTIHRMELFRGKLLTEMKLIGWCLSVEYSDFLEPVRGLAQYAISLRATASSHFNSHQESTGSSSESPQASASATL